MHFRFTSVLSFALAVVSFALTLALLLAGSGTNQMQDGYLVSLNMSKIGQGLVQFNPADNSNGGSSNSGDLLGQLGGLLGGIINDTTSQIGDQIENAEDQLISQIISRIGLDQYYDFFPLHICQGNYSNPDDPKSKKKPIKCYDYNDKSAGFNTFNNLTKAIPSSLVIAGTNISAPVISELGSTFDYMDSQITTLTKAILAFYIISLIGSGLTALGSLVGVFFAKSAFIAYLCLGASTLSGTFQMIGAIAITALITTTHDLLNRFGRAINLKAETGDEALAFSWISAVFIMLANLYWFVIWFVEFRTFAFKLRRRSPDEIGNYRGILREMRSDLHREPAMGFTGKERP